jgi:alkanesulfonate monooxygenase SsuD/methylene tetrahydromethanopterin reductase-like flavin-dependent oxidoreductase (luciferase family)
VPLSVGEDVEAAAAPLRAYTALYVGGMGSRQQNFYNALVRRMGYEEAAQTVQDLYLDRRHRDAMAAVPLDLIEATCLVGPAAKVRDRVQAYAQAGVTTLSVSPAQGPLPARIAMLRTLVEAVEAAGVAS